MFYFTRDKVHLALPQHLRCWFRHAAVRTVTVVNVRSVNNFKVDKKSRADLKAARPDFGLAAFPTTLSQPVA